MIRFSRTTGGLAALALCFTSQAGAWGFRSPTLSALQGEAPEIAVPKPPRAAPVSLAQQGAPPSQSYRAFVVNNDGSIRILQPFFRNPTGEGALHLSSRSDAGGVCKLYGFGPAQAWETEGDYNRTAVIDAGGRLAGYGTYDPYGANNSRLSEIYCGPGPASTAARPTVRERSEAVHVNDDGSTTIVAPFVPGLSGAQVPLSARGNLRGTCRYFGFPEYVTHVSGGDHSRTVAIGADGRISGIGRYDRYGANNSSLRSIVCR